MDQELRFLILEDLQTDVEMILRELRKADFRFTHTHVDSREGFLKALQNPPPDLILMDYSLPGFDAMSALHIVHQVAPLVPSIVISEIIDEEAAVKILKKGATDYILKSRMARLVPAVRRALIEAEKHADLLKAQTRITEQAMLLDKARDAIMVLDLADRITFWNKSAERLYGWSENEAIGRNALEMLYKGLSHEVLEARSRTFETGEWIGELRQVDRNGREIIVESRRTLIRERGEVTSVLVVNTDITERKKIESQLLRAQRMESVGMLAGGIAHDLNNILAPILMAAETLKTRQPNPEDQKLLSTIEGSAQRGADIVKHVLMFARGVEGVHSILRPDQFIADLKKILDETFPKSIQIITDIPTGLWSIYGDVTQFQQVLLNLCVNARDAMPSGGTLTIRARNDFLKEGGARQRPGQYVDLEVSDTGEGIPAENLDKIFEPFFTTKAVGHGTGLGLSTALAIVKSHGGFLDVRSQVGNGTTFTIHLPALENVEMRQTRQVRRETPQGHGEWVLVVDDEASIREMTKETLNTFGYNILTAKDAFEALSLFERNKEKVEVVLVDMLMPIMDGSECMMALRKIKSGVRLILTSGLDDHQRLCRENPGLCIFLPKPYTAEKLLITVHDLLRAG